MNKFFEGFLSSNKSKNCSFQGCCLARQPRGSIHICVVYVTHTPGAGQYTSQAAIHSGPGSVVGASLGVGRVKKILKDYLVQALHL